MSTTTPEDWGSEYGERFVRYSRFCDKLKVLFEELLELKQMEVVQVEARPKDPNRFVAKQRRKQYDDPFEEMTDIVGLRVIVYYVDELNRIGELIAGEFEQDPDNTHINRLQEDPERFGYESDHYVVTLPGSRAAMSDWAAYEGIKFEIQVRTALQHAWGAISRKLAYQVEEEVPRELRRQLFRLSALLELADKEFSDFRASTERVFVTRRSEVQKGELDAALDISSLEAYLEVHPHEQNWADVAKRLGSDVDAVDDDYRTTELSSILGTLESKGVTRLRDLHELLTDASTWGEDALRSVIEKSPNRRPSPIDIVHFLILIGTGADEAIVGVVGYYDDLRDALNEVIAERRS